MGWMNSGRICHYRVRIYSKLAGEAALYIEYVAYIQEYIILSRIYIMALNEIFIFPYAFVLYRAYGSIYTILCMYVYC